MCCILTCFGWLLDLIQKFITFFLCCVIMVMVGATLSLAAVVGIAYGYNYFVVEHKNKLNEPDVTIASIVQDTLEDLSRINGRRLGVQDNFPNMNKNKSTTHHILKEHLPLSVGNNKTDDVLRNLIEKNSYYKPVTNKLNNQPLVPQPGETYESWWDHVANQLLLPDKTGVGTSNPSQSGVSPDIINLMPFFKTPYRTLPSKDVLYTITRSSMITSKPSSAIYNMSRHGTTLERPMTHITLATDNARETTDDTDRYIYIENFPAIKEIEIAHLSKNNFSRMKSTQKLTRTSKSITTNRKTKSFINPKKDKIKTTQTNLKSASRTTISTEGVTKADSSEEYEYNDILVGPPARTSTTQSKRTWKNLFKFSTRKATKFKEFEKSDEEYFYKDRPDAMNFSKVRFQETTSSEEYILRFAYKGPVINEDNPEDDDRNTETYD